MFNAIHQLVNILPARPRATIRRLVPRPPAPQLTPSQAPAAKPRGSFLSRWLDPLGPDFDLGDLELDEADVSADLQRGRR